MTKTEHGKRFERQHIYGTLPDAGWTVNWAGIFHRHRHPKEITDELGGLPTIDFGHRWLKNPKLVIPHYHGPVPSAGAMKDTRRLVEEIVCYQFHGPPPGSFQFARVEHLDGDPQNCAADNLRWVTDRILREYRWKGIMRPGFLPVHRGMIFPTRGAKQVTFVEGNKDIVQHQPVQPINGGNRSET
jgi:hypothetical protein